MSGRLFEGTANLNKAAAEVAQMSQDLAAGAQKQAAAIQETSSAVTEISSTVARNSEHATKSQQHARTCQTDVGSGKTALQGLLQGLDDLKVGNQNLFELVNKNNSKMDDLVKVIQEIGSKTTVINDIVFQTKLLSFNASVEAARAGESGKGFAVVAEEVGNLARMSGAAAKEISSLLEISVERVSQIAKESRQSIDAMVSEAGQRSATVLERVRVCESTFGRINDSTGEVVQGMEQIYQATVEQDVGMREISKAVGQLDATTQASAKSSEMAAKSSGTLASEAKALEDIISELIAEVKGGNAALASPSPSVINHGPLREDESPSFQEAA